jgi:hypothetical protein
MAHAHIRVVDRVVRETDILIRGEAEVEGISDPPTVDWEVAVAWNASGPSRNQACIDTAVAAINARHGPGTVGAGDTTVLENGYAEI